MMARIRKSKSMKKTKRNLDINHSLNNQGLLRQDSQRRTNFENCSDGNLIRVFRIFRNFLISLFLILHVLFFIFLITLISFWIVISRTVIFGPFLLFLPLLLRFLSLLIFIPGTSFIYALISTLPTLLFCLPYSVFVLFIFFAFFLIFITQHFLIIPTHLLYLTLLAYHHLI